MGRRDEAVEWIHQGHSPDRIAALMGISLATVLGYLDEMIGRGEIRRSDVYFSLSEEVRRQPLTSEQAEVVRRYGSARSALGDVYEEIRDIETGLHERIRLALVEVFGPDERGWWRQGIPQSVRTKCAERREEDRDPVDEPYCYTDLLDLCAILDANWASLAGQVGSYDSDKRGLLRDLRRLNDIRRIVMHPVRGAVPSEEDFAFLRAMREELDD